MLQPSTSDRGNIPLRRQINDAATGREPRHLEFGFGKLKFACTNT